MFISKEEEEEEEETVLIHSNAALRWLFVVFLFNSLDFFCSVVFKGHSLTHVTLCGVAFFCFKLFQLDY